MNTKLMWDTLEYIESHPDEHDQLSWKSCFAGIALRLAREEGMDIPDVEAVFMTTCNCFSCQLLASSEITRLTEEQLEEMRTGPRAEILLGLTKDQARILFSGGNSREDLRILVQTWAPDASRPVQKVYPAVEVPHDITWIFEDIARDLPWFHTPISIEVCMTRDLVPV